MQKDTSGDTSSYFRLQFFSQIKNDPLPRAYNLDQSAKGSDAEEWKCHRLPWTWSQVGLLPLSLLGQWPRYPSTLRHRHWWSEQKWNRRSPNHWPSPAGSHAQDKLERPTGPEGSPRSSAWSLTRDKPRSLRHWDNQSDCLWYRSEVPTSQVCWVLL